MSAPESSVVTDRVTSQETASAAPESVLTPSRLLRLQRSVGNATTARVVTVQRGPANQGDSPSLSAVGHVAFVREEGLNLRAGPDLKAGSLARLPFGQRVHLLDGGRGGWQKVTVLGKTGFIAAGRIHQPPAELIQRDPGLALIKVRSGQNFWGLVKEVYGVQGDEGTPDQNVNHFINAIRAVNRPEAFSTKTDALDDIENALIPGRDASDTQLIANVDLWIPSFHAAAAMDVASGTVTGEVSRAVKKIERKVEDFRAACLAAGTHVPEAIGRRAGEMGEGILNGLIEFALDAAKILAVSTAAGALIGALFGGVGALPGAEIGFEIGLMILEAYGLYMLIEAILGVAGSLLSQLGQFISLAWNANGDPKQIDQAGKVLADALGILVSAVMVVVSAYLLKRGTKALSKTKFAKTVGETKLARWAEARQKMTTTREVVSGGGATVAALAREEARRLLSAAAREEGAVTATLKDVAANSGGRMAGLENVLKSEASLTRKITDQANALVERGVPVKQAVAQVSAGIKDALRYTMEIPAERYMAAYQQTARALEARGCVRAASKNTWAEPGSPQAGPYRGINESWRTPDGQVFELQFHTPESFVAKTESHLMYEEMRAAGTSPERIAELAERMTKASDKIPVPEGAVPVDGAWPGGPGQR